MSSTFTPGQRWVSDNEPELGLGVVLSAGRQRIEVLFPAADEHRTYAAKGAPLRRVVFKAGDRVRTSDGSEHVIDQVREHGGLVVYQTGGRQVTESELLSTISFNTAEERLLAGHVDDAELFDLRAEALARRSDILASPARGFVAARIDLIPHQLSIAGEVATRLRPRVLLADEVGLGKTIEAGLIVHRLHLTGRADRVLVLVPEQLVHQWFVELLRRFNMPFSIFDEARVQSIEHLEPESNPFLDAQHVLCDVAWLAGDPRRAAQAVEVGWNVIVVDEAHNLRWSPSSASDEYRLVESLAFRAPGLLLLTATPQQLGPEGHFARLRLLDPERYGNVESFAAEAGHYERTAATLQRIIDQEPLTSADEQLLAQAPARIHRSAAQMLSGSEEGRRRVVADLLDSFGTGRVMFRNTRAMLSGFPERNPHLYPIPAIGEDEFNPRADWLSGLLRRLHGEKILLICHAREMAERIQDWLRQHARVKTALFHEGLTLVQRDRNAAYFSEEDGARLLICSEIGSEGRNFQFAHHLVLFDLPTDPEILEHRIGRLDRIGQRNAVDIHVPYVVGTASEVLARWYHEGLNAFADHIGGTAALADCLGGELSALLRDPEEVRLRNFLQRSHIEAERISGELSRGYEKLLEMNSLRPRMAARIASEIRRWDSDRGFETFVLRILDFFGVNCDELADRTYHLRAGNLLTDSFPEIPEDGMRVTFDRDRALSREDLAFFTAEHPFVTSVIELMLSGEWGNASLAASRSTDGNPDLLLEMDAIAEVVASPAINVSRFLPPRPIRVVVDAEGSDRTVEAYDAHRRLRTADPARLAEPDGTLRRALPEMIDAALEIASNTLANIVADAERTAFDAFEAEIARLEDLREINPDVSIEEIEGMKLLQVSVAEAIARARLRVGGLRAVLVLDGS